MKRKLFVLVLLAHAFAIKAQIKFPVTITPDWQAKTVWMPKSPLNSQNIFIGGVDTVQTTATYGNVAGFALAKQWHDFIGFTPETDPVKLAAGELGWVIVNHEMILKDDKIGDGGGMTAFKIKRNMDGSLEVIHQTLPDGRSGKFFNVDFANTTGETGMNCGGIVAPTGRIWTAEEWYQSSNAGMSSGLRDTTDFVIGTTTPAGFPGFNGKKLKKFENFNWMVEVDPKTGKAIRKQYNWGRAGWEGGAIMPDNKTVYLFEDGTPGMLGKFVASTPGHFTQGQLYIYKHDAPGKWIPIENNLDTLVNLRDVAFRRGATMFTRLEWGAVNATNGKVYITETGNDNPGSAFKFQNNGVVAPHLIKAYKDRYQVVNGVAFPGNDLAAADSVKSGKFRDYYGRVLEFDPVTGTIVSYIEGGPLSSSGTSVSTSAYPAIHLTNPDGLNFAYINGKTYMVIQEDLNGRTWNRMPSEYQGGDQTICETYMLDMSISNPTFNDLLRVTACAPGAEITGAIFIDSKTMLVNCQHPASTNSYPYNNSLTYAVSGWDAVPAALIRNKSAESNFVAYPNPVAGELFLNMVCDIAVYDMSGKRLKVLRDVQSVQMNDLAPGTYFIVNGDGESFKVIVQ